jgi:hypothetical protein
MFVKITYLKAESLYFLQIISKYLLTLSHKNKGIKMSKQQQDDSKATLNDYYIEQKVTCFCDTYTDCPSEREADEVYTSTKLRKYFEAYLISGLGDLLSIYLSRLSEMGFHLRTSVSGQPAIFVKQKDNSSSIALLIDQ